MEPDPLTAFVHEFDCDGEPPPGWVERWSLDGDDPIAVAWRRSTSSSPMHQLLVLIHSAHEATALAAWTRARASHDHPPGPRRGGPGCPTCADAIRAAVPPPPPLAKVLRTRCDDHVRRLWATEVDAGRLLYMAGRSGLDRRLVVRAACDCVRLAAAHLPADAPCFAAALRTTERWTQGEATEEALQRALDDTAAALLPLHEWAAALEYARQIRSEREMTRDERRRWASLCAAGAARDSVWAAYFVESCRRAPSMTAKDAAGGAVLALSHANRREGEVLHHQPPFSPSVQEAQEACIYAIRARIPALPAT